MEMFRYYRVMQVHDGYQIEESVDMLTWKTSVGYYYLYGISGRVPYWYKTLFFAKRKLKSLVKYNAKEDKISQRRDSFVPKVVYGPYP